jgi:uncharacterized membrane protein
MPANREPITHPPPKAPGLTSVLARNIRTLSERREREEQEASLQDRIAGAVTRFTGSMGFVYLHVALFGFWIIANLGWVPRVPVWDSSFVILAMWASVEAIFLSTFVLIAQNRMQVAADKRADLDLQISLLAEHEITKLATLLDAVAQRLNVPVEPRGEFQEVKRDITPEAVLDELEERAPDV